MPAQAVIPIAKARRLRELETVIRRGQAAFVAVGQALAEIKSKKLFRVQGYRLCGLFVTSTRRRRRN